MNANELNPISKIHIMRVYAGRANPEYSLIYEKWEEELRILLDRFRIRETAKEPPTREDGDECAQVLAYPGIYGMWSSEFYDYVNSNPKSFTYWTHLPEAPNTQEGSNHEE